MPSEGDGQGPIFLSATDYALPKVIPEGVDKYTGYREMARGGCAILRTCFDQMTGRTIVMKSLLTKYLLDKQENQRLLREARITAQLQHPNTVPVYDIGRHKLIARFMQEAELLLFVPKYEVTFRIFIARLFAFFYIDSFFLPNIFPATFL